MTSVPPVLRQATQILVAARQQLSAATGPMLPEVGQITAQMEAHLPALQALQDSPQVSTGANGDSVSPADLRDWQDFNRQSVLAAQRFNGILQAGAVASDDIQLIAPDGWAAAGISPCGPAESVEDWILRVTPAVQQRGQGITALVKDRVVVIDHQQTPAANLQRHRQRALFQELLFRAADQVLQLAGPPAADQIEPTAVVNGLGRGCAFFGELNRRLNSPKGPPEGENSQGNVNASVMSVLDQVTQQMCEKLPDFAHLGSVLAFTRRPNQYELRMGMQFRNSLTNEITRFDAAIEAAIRADKNIDWIRPYEWSDIGVSLRGDQESIAAWIRRVTPAVQHRGRSIAANVDHKLVVIDCQKTAEENAQAHEQRSAFEKALSKTCSRIIDLAEQTPRRSIDEMLDGCPVPAHPTSPDEWKNWLTKQFKRVLNEAEVKLVLSFASQNMRENGLDRTVFRSIIGNDANGLNGDYWLRHGLRLVSDDAWPQDNFAAELAR